ncbi:HTH-type transcriptional regulator [Dinoroseobacter shibae DFL 12 = DSM 16493]|uniref:HTH-type transcriptional regulator n=2 Tax=Roseobacteraceae TaxID=2854170 RepID=A8LLL7_DINSH|nr:HTH-type transcriptional regulator [Dinoroseobacter shibae DFL 12 = DSM 16493]
MRIKLTPRDNGHMNLKQLSEKLGLSPTTVSRALNGYPEVSENTRRRIQEAAEQYNYFPSARARSLATGRAMAIGHVLPMTISSEMVNPVFGDFLAGAAETYSKSGYDITLSSVRAEDELKCYRDFAAKRIVDGVIVHAPRTDDPRIALLKELGLPFVVHGRAPIADDSYAWLDINNRRAFYRATKLLIDLGHREIALINGQEQMDFAQRRRAGYSAAMHSAELTLRPELMVSEEMTEGVGYAAAKRMLSLKKPPTAFLVSSIITAIGVRRAVSDLGLRLGQDISVVIHDDEISYLRNGDTEPLFTATRSSVRAAGRRAAEILLQQIAQPEAAPVQELWEVELSLGQSTGPVRHS